MSVRIRLLPTFALLGAGSLFCGQVSAFCRARSCDPDAPAAVCALDPETQCSIDGVELKRSNACPVFGVQKGGGAELELSDTEFQEMVAAAFRLWMNVDCGNGPPSLAVRSVGIVPAKRPFTCSERSLNLDTWFFTPTSFSGPPPLGGSTAGKTQPKFIEATGEMFDADVQLNTALFLSKKSDPAWRGLLATTIAHEAGHVLGLSHSADSGALMAKSYTLTPNRQLTADDIRGICALYPSMPSLECSVPGVSQAALDEAACDLATHPVKAGSCAMVSGVASGGASHWLAGALVGVLAALRVAYTSRNAKAPNNPLVLNDSICQALNDSV